MTPRERELIISLAKFVLPDYPHTVVFQKVDCGDYVKLITLNGLDENTQELPAGSFSGLFDGVTYSMKDLGITKEGLS